MEILSLRGLLFADLKLQFFLFSIEESIGIVFAAFAFTEFRIAFFALSITAAVHFEALDIFAETAIGGMVLLFFGEKLIFEFNTVGATKSDETEFIGVQEAVAVLTVTLLVRTGAIMHVFMATAAAIMVVLFYHFVMFWF